MKASKPVIRIPLYDLKLSRDAKRQVADTLASGWLTTGPKVAAFELALAEFLKVKHVSAVSSGTIGLQLVLTAIGAGPGTEVITTPFTFVATVEAILAAGATPVLADIKPTTLNIDPDEVARKISRHTVAVMPVDIGGYPADYAQLGPVCEKHSLPLIADAAHSFGATYKNKSIPRLTDAAVYSLHSTKNLTCGEGGLVVSRHKVLIDRIKTHARHGLTSNAYTRKASSGWKYDATHPGFKANMSDIHAAIGLGQLAVFERQQKKRRELAERYTKQLSALTDCLEIPLVEKNYRHAWHLFIIRLHLSALKIDRNRFIESMADRGVECGVHFQPIFELSFYRDALGLSPQYFPNTAYAGRRVVSLPMYPDLKMREVDYVCECVADIVKKHVR